MRTFDWSPSTIGVAKMPCASGRSKSCMRTTFIEKHRSHFRRAAVNCAARTPQDGLIGPPASAHDVIKLMELRDQLPDHPVPDEIRRRPAAAAIRIEGLVAHPVTLDGPALAALRMVLN